MKNIELFPLSRNRYYPGKQLVTRDMEAEQRYFNNKRRLLNSLLHGCGIVCGLLVTAVKQTTSAGGEEGVSVVVEPGLAIDGTGREIVVPEQVYLRLSDLDGFDAASGLEDSVYLCLEYMEILREPMHSVLDTAVADDHFNRVEESCRFYLTYTEPVTPKAARGHEDPGALKSEYYSENLEKKLNKIRNEKLCLAKIGLVRWGSAYAIGEVEPVPFGQYVLSAELSLDLCETALRQINNNFHEEAATVSEVPTGGAPLEAHMRTGVVPLDIPAGLKPGAVFYSDDIPHGLGVGTVSMSVGLKSGEGVIYGPGGIFEESGGYEYAFQTDEKAGTFKIGVRLVTTRWEERLLFNWLALRDPADTSSEASKPCLVIIPEVARVKVRESIQFTCRAYGLKNAEATWLIREPEGGRIEANGFYLAPNTPGVYEITAQSIEQPEVRAAAFVVVGA